MDWQDQEFEAFLRQFQPNSPKELPTRRWTVVALAAAAVLVLGVALPMTVSFRGRPSVPRGIKGSLMVPGLEAPPPRKTPGSPQMAPPAAKTPSARVDGRSPQQLDGLSASDGVLRVGRLGVKAPRKVVDVKPIYPDEARAANASGVVVLQIMIGEEGSVLDWAVVRSAGPLLDQAAIDAVSQWQFEPTLLNGVAVKVMMNILINFTGQ